MVWENLLCSVFNLCVKFFSTSEKKVFKVSEKEKHKTYISFVGHTRHDHKHV